MKMAFRSGFLPLKWRISDANATRRDFAFSLLLARPENTETGN